MFLPRIATKTRKEKKSGNKKTWYNFLQKDPFFSLTLPKNRGRTRDGMKIELRRRRRRERTEGRNDRWEKKFGLLIRPSQSGFRVSLGTHFNSRHPYIFWPEIMSSSNLSSSRDVRPPLLLLLVSRPLSATPNLVDLTKKEMREKASGQMSFRSGLSKALCLSGRAGEWIKQMDRKPLQ